MDKRCPLETKSYSDANNQKSIDYEHWLSLSQMMYNHLKGTSAEMLKLSQNIKAIKIQLQIFCKKF